MIRHIFILFIVLICCRTTYSQKKNLCNENLVDYKGIKINNDSIKSGTTIFFITSYTCGWCIKSIPKYEKIKTEYPRVNCIGILDNDSLFIENFKLKHKQEFWFTKISDPNLILATKYWKRKVWPEFHIYRNGKLIKRLVDASDETFNKLINIIDKFEKKVNS